MRRRRLLFGGAAAMAASAGGFGLWLVGEPAPVQGLPDITAALRWLARVAADPAARSRDGWSLPQVLEHAAQSIEYSLDGYPEAKSVLFQHSAGALAFATFNRRGAMRHPLTEAIPGAPSLSASDVGSAQQRLAAALERFAAHRGPLAPHFAFGALGKPDYERAHLMHLADHARWIVPGP